MSAEGRYFQFPLCALAYGKETNDYLQAICSYGVVHLAKSLPPVVDADRANGLVNGPKPLPPGTDSADDFHLNILIAAEMLSVNPGSMTRMIERYREVNKIQSQISSGNDRGCIWVRIRTDLLWDCHDKKGITDRQFSALCAVYSVIGDNRYRQVTREQIKYRMLGYRDEEEMKRHRAGKKGFREPITEYQIRATLDELDDRSLFVRVQVSRRAVVFSNRMTRDELVTKVVEEAKFSAQAEESRKRCNESTLATLKALRRGNHK